MRNSTLSAACVLLTTAMLCWPCAAQEQAAAEALFRSAREAADRGDWVTACDRFEESHRLEPAPGTVFNLANCREKLGQTASAWKRYGEVVQRLPKTDPRVTYARNKERELEPRVPRLTLLAPIGDERVEVTVNGMKVERPAFGVPLPLDPGRVVIRLETAGRAPSEHESTLAEGEKLEHQLTVGAPLSVSESSASEPARREPKPRSAAVPWGYVALGSGALGASAATVGFIWAANESSVTSDPAHCRGEYCDEIGVNASQRGEAAVVLGWAGVAVGALGIGLGTFLLTRSEGETVSLSVRPLVGGAALALGGQL